MNSPLDTPLPPDDTGYLPLLDHSALDALLFSLDSDQDAVDGFVATFVAHWPERLHRAEASVAARDRAAIYDCALSIKVAAQMIGAVRLSACGGQLESLVRAGRIDEAPCIVDALRQIGTETVDVLMAGSRSRSTEHAA
ncbi:HPt (histidine-containing phosphotransfer) domain-containing protein [Mycetocola sp. CAN_C7]|uniref:Hpt domain-containing protein n=1 Tax=Mycetocola sp. CAN_C7 TaxID=2787724 RepID=UPI0018CBA97D